ncbi:MAG: dihydroorotate dehydrogenase [Firmicutes bacterium]|nr:dihydroorotate dehydrogenase [Bacillota bacterium]HPU01327.1 dihydroorotate dehydrogenase [Bacillota bacterium]
METDPRLALDLAGIKMRNPLIAASGCYGFGFDYLPWVDPRDWGAIALKGMTLKPRAGNPPPRLAETPSGLLNAIGLQNPGIDYFLEAIRPRLGELGCPVIANIAGESVEEYRELAAILDRVAEVSAVEINISCPNVRRGGISFGQDPATVEKLVGAVRRVYRGPLIVKLSLEAGDIAAVARAAESGGADILSLINTLKGMVIDVHSRRPLLGNITGGLSGPAIRPVAVRAVWEVAGAVSLPLIGMGGIASAEDALQFILAGAAAVAVGTANFVHPHVAREICRGLQRYLDEQGMGHYSELIGAARG